MAQGLLLSLGALSLGEDVGHPASAGVDDLMQFLILVAAVLLSIATAVAGATAILSLLFRLMAKLR